MALKIYKCSKCGSELKTLKTFPLHCELQMEPMLSAPQVTFLEPRDPEDRSGKSVMKDQNQILKERAKTHIRENELNDLIQEHGSAPAEVNGWVNEKGVVRKKIDEL